MKFSLNGSEMADWMECWCFRCANDHDFSHGPDDGNGCDILVKTVTNEDAPEFTAHGDKWFMTIPAGVVCSAFTQCLHTSCQDGPEAERRGGETRREFHDRLRAEIIALPLVEVHDD